MSNLNFDQHELIDRYQLNWIELRLNLREIIMSGYIKEEEEEALIHEDSTVISALTLPTLPSHQSTSQPNNNQIITN